MKRDIAAQLEDILEEYADSVEAIKNEAAEVCAKEAAQKLKNTSPIGTGPKAGRYAKGWRATETDSGWTTYNATDSQLTHLLENGHDLYIHGTYVGTLEGKEHIKPVEEEMVEKYQETIERKL